MNGSLKDIGAMAGYIDQQITLDSLEYSLYWLSNIHNSEIQEARDYVIDFCSREVLQIEEKRFGFPFTSGSEVNEYALFFALKCKKFDTGDRSQKYILCTNNSHSSVKSAAEKLGLGIIVLEPYGEQDFQITPQQLIKTVEKYKEDIVCVVATYGTTNLGLVEDFILDNDVQACLQKYNIKIHIDAAWGGFNIGLNGISDDWKNTFVLADSVTIDPHKFIGVVGCGVLLVKTPNYIAGVEVNYYKGKFTFLGTTRGAFATMVAARHFKKYKKEGLKKMAEEVEKKGEVLRMFLQKNNIKQVYEGNTTNNIAVLCSDEKHMEKVIARALADGFILYKTIEQKEKQLFGVRICITPREVFTEELVAEIIEKFPRWYNN